MVGVFYRRDDWPVSNFSRLLASSSRSVEENSLASTEYPFMRGLRWLAPSAQATTTSSVSTSNFTNTSHKYLAALALELPQTSTMGSANVSNRGQSTEVLSLDIDSPAVPINEPLWLALNPPECPAGTRRDWGLGVVREAISQQAFLSVWSQLYFVSWTERLSTDRHQTLSVGRHGN